MVFEISELVKTLLKNKKHDKLLPGCKLLFCLLVVLFHKQKYIFDLLRRPLVNITLLSIELN